MKINFTDSKAFNEVTEAIEKIRTVMSSGVSDTFRKECQEFDMALERERMRLQGFSVEKNWRGKYQMKYIDKN